MKLTEMPAYCSSCFQQQQDRLHVDLDAAWDGPVLEGSIKVSIDDLVLCEDCIRTAYRLLPSKRDEETAALKKDNHALIEQNRTMAEYVAVLEKALASSPNVTKNVKEQVGG